MDDRIRLKQLFSGKNYPPEVLEETIAILEEFKPFLEKKNDIFAAKSSDDFSEATSMRHILF